MDYLRNRGIKPGFSTNGLLLEKHAQRIVESNVEMLSVSLDSHHATVHDEIRGHQGLFDKAC